MTDVYRKDGRPDRIVDTEAERVKAVWDGFQLVKDEKPADAKTEGTKAPEAKTNNTTKTQS